MGVELYNSQMKAEFHLRHVKEARDTLDKMLLKGIQADEFTLTGIFWRSFAVIFDGASSAVILSFLLEVSTGLFF